MPRRARSWPASATRPRSSYLAEMAELVLRETGLLPHLNPGMMTRADIDALRKVSVSQGIMLESAAERLRQRGGPHFGSPDKDPACGSRPSRDAGEAAVPFTSGILIGIGETRRERIEALLALRELHERHGHIQEIIIQNFRAKPGTRMADAPEPDLDEHLWTIAVARLIFGPAMNIQAPPNLNPGALAEMIDAGINDWGGVSPVTPDHVNPEAPWPALDRLARADRRRRQGAGRAPGDLPRLCAASPSAGSIRHCAPRCCGRWTPKASPASDTWIAGRRQRAADRYEIAAALHQRLAAGNPRPGRGRRGARRRPRSCACSRRAATLSTQVCGPPTGCGGGSTATRSAMSSPATSTTPTSAISAASSAPSPRASSAKICAAGLTISISPRSSAASRRPGSAARPRSACKAASTPNIPAPPISGSAARSRTRRPASTSTPSRRSKSGKARRPSAAPCPIFCAS